MPEAHESDTEETQKLAAAKLERLFSKNFDAFCIRFVSFQEYRDCMREGVFQGEVYIPREEDREAYTHGIPRHYEGLPPVKNFTEYLGLAKKFGWKNIADIQTGWTHVVETMDISGDVLRQSLFQHRERLKEKPNSFEARNDVMSSMQKYVRYFLQSRLGYHPAAFTENGADQRMINAIGQEYSDTIIEALRDPQFLAQKENRRKVFTAMNRLPRSGNNSAYHLALIFDESALSKETTWNLPYWHLLNNDEKSQHAALLAVIAISGLMGNFAGYFPRKSS